MIYKTLIIVDSNKLRQGNGDGTMKYSNFEFGGDFKELSKIIKKKELDSYINIAIPEIVLEELKKQKIESFEIDYSTLKNIEKRLSKVEATVLYELKKDFDMSSHIDNCKKDFLEKNKEILIIGIKEEEYPEIFKNLINRAVNKEKPFKQIGKKASDAGFKDVVIWESVLRSDVLKDFDRIILFTNDDGFSDCKAEFDRKHNKYFDVVKDLATLETDIINTYEDYIKLKPFYDYTETEYFKEIVNEQLKNEKEIWIDPESKFYNISSYKVLDYSVKIEETKMDLEEAGFIESEYDYFDIILKVEFNLEGGAKSKQNYTITIDEFNQFIQSELK